MQTKQIGIVLLIGLLILGVIGAGIPYTTSQFIWQSTDLNYVKFYAGEYDGNGLIIDGNIFTIFDLNGSGGSGSFTDTNFETAGLTLTGSNTGDQDLSGYLQLAGDTMTGALKMGDNVTINQGGSDQYEQYFDGTNMNFDLTSGNFIFTGGDFDIEDTSPYFTLKDTSNSGTSSVSRIQFKGSDDVVNSWIGDTSSGDGDFEIRNILDADLEFWTNNLKRMIIDNGGRVGIGTPNPGEKLEVNGNIKQTADNDKIIQGAVDEYSQYFDGTNQNFETTSGDIILNPTGNVGIGTATPSEKLEVNGNIRVPSTTFAEQYGIIYKGTVPFIHDFSYGLNAGGITPGGRNTFVGVDAGNFTMGSTATTTSHGSYNNAIGYQSLRFNTTGYNNNAMGYASLYSNTTGSYNNAMGYASLRYNTTGSYNNASGAYSLRSNTTGTYNNASGASSLRYNTTGHNNNAMGYASLYANTTGTYNNAMGAYSLYDLEDGSSNTGVGYNTGGGITYGSGNTILGASVTGLDAGLTNNIILANGTGAIKAQHDGTNWSLTGNVDLGANDLNTTGSVKGVHKTADGTSAVADGTYNFYNDGATSGQVTSMTIKDGLITSITEAS